MFYVRCRYVIREELDIERFDDIIGDWIPRLKGVVGALKIDIEGYEAMVRFSATYTNAVTLKQFL